MLSLKSSSAIYLAIILLVISSVLYSSTSTKVAVTASEEAPQPNEGGEEMDIAEVARQREQNELEIIGRAREKIGTAMKPNQLINYCLNPTKRIDRFDLEDHFKMKDNELGVFVIGKDAKQMGVMNGQNGTVIYSSSRKGGKVVEEKIQNAKHEFPMGWRKIGPDGILKQKYQFKKELSEVLKGAGAGKENAHVKDVSETQR